MVFRIAAALVCLLLAPRPSDACSEEAPEPFELDDSSDDQVPPAAPVLQDLWIERFDPSPGTDPDQECSGALARLHVAVEVADDRTPTGELGFETEVVSGSVPFTADLEIRRAESVSGSTAAELVYRWGRSSYDDPVEATLEVTPIDTAGNRGEPVLVELSDPGTEGGCQVAPNGGAGWALFAVIALLAGRRRSWPSA